jgi:large subunit ribosomal protein L5
MISRINIWYKSIISKDLTYKLNTNTIFQIDKLSKIVLTCNTNNAIYDPKNVIHNFILLELLSNQKPKIIRAKKSVATFNLRKFSAIGGKTTLRNKEMYYWIDLFIFIVQPKLPKILFFNTNNIEKAPILSIGMNIFTIGSFPQLTRQNDYFLKDLGLMLIVESLKKNKLSTALITNGFQAPISIQ